MNESKNNLTNKATHFFIDFDGTVSTVDVVDAVLEKFADKKWLEIEALWQEGRIGSRECLQRQFELMNAGEEEFDRFIDTITYDEHFYSFILAAHARGCKTTIVSDGFDKIIYKVLRKIFRNDQKTLSKLEVYANQLIWQGDRFEAQFPAKACEHGCANCKVEVMKRLASLESTNIIFVGDGTSDRYGAAASHLCFAKKKLLTHCQSAGIAHQAYESFSDIEKWLVSAPAGFHTEALIK